MSDSITIYRPNQRHEYGVFKTWKIMAGNIVSSRELIWQLFKREFLASYKKSFFGITWLFIAPIMGIVSWVFLQKTGMLKPGDVGIPYPAYVLLGSSMWGLYMGFFNSSAMTLMSGRGLVMQVRFPREVLLFQQTAQRLAIFLVSFVINLLVLAFFGIVPSMWIFLFPLVALPMFFFAAAIGLVTSMISVVGQDFLRALQIVMGLLMWATPIVYSREVDNPIVQFIIEWNPLTYLVCSARDIIIYGRLYDTGGYFICAGLSVAMFLLSWRMFFVSEDRLIEKML